MAGILRFEGLPFKTTSEELKKWIQDLSQVESEKIHMISNRFGLSSGEALVVVKEVEETKVVRESCDEKTIGESNRYVKIFITDQEELDWQLQRQEIFKGVELFCVRMNGLPFKVSEYKAAKWFKAADSNCVDVQIHLNQQGRRSGDATAFFLTLEEAKKAMTKNKDDMEGRFINLSMLTEAAATFDTKDDTSISKFSLKMSGLPYKATETEMKEFFLPQAKCSGIKVILNREGRPSGDAIASFEDEEALQAALGKNREHLGSRFILLSRFEEGQMNAFSIKMGGLPYKARIQEIKDFFGPDADCLRIRILKTRDNRPSGEAIAEFATKEAAMNAMKKDKEYLGERFVKLTPIGF